MKGAGHRQVTSGLPAGYRWVTNGLPVCYQWATGRLPAGYRRGSSRLPVSYRWATGGLPPPVRLITIACLAHEQGLALRHNRWLHLRQPRMENVIETPGSMQGEAKYTIPFWFFSLVLTNLNFAILLQFYERWFFGVYKNGKCRSCRRKFLYVTD